MPACGYQPARISLLPCLMEEMGVHLDVRVRQEDRNGERLVRRAARASGGHGSTRQAPIR